MRSADRQRGWWLGVFTGLAGPALFAAAPSTLPATGPAGSGQSVSAAPVVPAVQKLRQQFAERMAAGRFNAALDTLDDLEKLTPHDSEVNFDRACALSGMGSVDDALDALSKAVDQGGIDANRLTEDASLAPLQGDARFGDLLASVVKKEDATYARFPYQPAKKVAGIKYVEANPPGALRYRIMMDPSASDDQPDRLLVWFHPVGTSRDADIERLAPEFIKHHVAVMVFTQKDRSSWSATDASRLRVSLKDAAHTPGIDLQSRPLALGMGAGGQMAIQMEAQHPELFAGLAVDAAYPVIRASAPATLMEPPGGADARRTPVLAVYGENDSLADAWPKVAASWQKAGVPLKVVAVPGRGNDWLFDNDARRKLLLAWLDEAAAVQFTPSAGDYAQFPYEKGADIPEVKTVEAIPLGGLHYRLRMSKTATAQHPDRLVVWFHPSGGSMDDVVEALSPELTGHHLALVVFTQKEYANWDPKDLGPMTRSIRSILKLPGISTKTPIAMGFSAGGQMMLQLYNNDPSQFAGLVLDAAYPVEADPANPGQMIVQPDAPKGPAVKKTPVLVFVGGDDGGTPAWAVVENNWRKAGVPLSINIIPNRKHEWLIDNADRQKILIDWLSAVAAGNLPGGPAATPAPAPASPVAPAAAPAPAPAPATQPAAVAPATRPTAPVRLTAQQAQAVEQVMQQAGQAMGARKWDHGLMLLDQVAQIVPNNPEVDYNRACCQARLGQKKDAVATLSRSVDEGFAQADHMAGDDDLASLHDDPRFAGIVARSRKIPDADLSVQEKEIRAESKYAQMKQQMQTGRWADAVATSDELVKLAPDNPDIAYDRACALARAGKRKDALAELDHSIDAGFTDYAHMQVDDDLQSLHGDPEFPKLVDKARKYGDDYTRFPLEKGAEIPQVKTVEAYVDGGMRYRLRMSKDATPDHPDRLVVWFHPSGGSMDDVVESLAPELTRHHLALLVFPQKQYMGWSGIDIDHVNKTLNAVAKLPGINAKRALAVSFSAGGQMLLQLYAQAPDEFGGLVLDSAYPVIVTDPAHPRIQAPPHDPAVKKTPILAVIGGADQNGNIWRMAEPTWRKAGIPLTIKVIPRGMHQWLFNNPQRQKMLIDWLVAVNEGKLPADPSTQPATQPDQP